MLPLQHMTSQKGNKLRHPNLVCATNRLSLTVLFASNFSVHCTDKHNTK
jgi:hypothetical protein